MAHFVQIPHNIYLRQLAASFKTWYKSLSNCKTGHTPLVHSTAAWTGPPTGNSFSEGISFSGFQTDRHAKPEGSIWTSHFPSPTCDLQATELETHISFKCLNLSAVTSRSERLFGDTSQAYVHITTTLHLSHTISHGCHINNVSFMITTYQMTHG